MKKYEALELEIVMVNTSVTLNISKLGSPGVKIPFGGSEGLGNQDN